MEEKPTDEGQEKMPARNASHNEAGGPQKSNVMIWIAAIIVVAVIGIVYFSRGKNQTISPDAKSSSSDTTASSPTDANAKVFEISGKPFEFSVKEIRVKKGDTVKINFTSTQGMHDWVLDEFNAKTKVIQAGQSDSVEFTADKAGIFEYYCSVPTHRQQGMVGKLIVE